MSKNIETVTDIPQEFLESTTEFPFSALYLLFAESLRLRIVQEKENTSDSIKAFAFWLRPASQESIKKEFERVHFGHIALPIGLVFQVAPGNTEIQFIYTSMLALALGNKVAVRVSRRNSDEQRRLMLLIDEVLSDQTFVQLKHRLYFFTGEYDSSLMVKLSKVCDLRMLWGRKESIASIRTIPLKASAKDLSFANRISLCILNAAEVCQASNISLIVERLTRDINTFQQQACSSPLALIWIGADSEIERARQIFFQSLESYYTKKRGLLTPSELVSKHNVAQAVMMAYSSKSYRVGSWICIQLENDTQIDDELFVHHDGHGVLLDLAFSSINRFEKKLFCSPQTLTFFGYDRHALINELGFGGLQKIDRIEPVGTALDFSFIWDGINFLHEFCRSIR